MLAEAIFSQVTRHREGVHAPLAYRSSKHLGGSYSAAAASSTAIAGALNKAGLGAALLKPQGLRNSRIRWALDSLGLQAARNIAGYTSLDRLATAVNRSDMDLP